MCHFSRVLVATDDRPQIRPALRKAIYFANRQSTDLTLLRVRLPNQTGLSRWLHQLLMTAPAVSHRQQKAPRALNRDIHFSVKHCHAATLANAVLDELEHQEYDLLILEHHQYSALHCEFAHTEDWKLLQQVDTPVLFINNEPWRKDGKLLTTIEVEEEGEPHRQFNDRLLNVSDELARCFHQQMHLLSCYQAKDLSVCFEKNNHRHTSWEEQQWQRLVKSAKPLGLKKRQLHLAVGLPDDQIPEASRQWGTNLVVMGVAEHSSALSAIRGRASEQLLNRLKCDVLALKPRASLRQ